MENACIASFYLLVYCSLKEKYRKKPQSRSPFTSGLDLLAHAQVQEALHDDNVSLPVEASEEDSLLPRGAKRVQFKALEITQDDIEAKVLAVRADAGYGSLEGGEALQDNGETMEQPDAMYEYSLRRNPTEFLVVESWDDPIRQQITEIWNTVQLRTVWRPMVRPSFYCTAFVSLVLFLICFLMRRHLTMYLIYYKFPMWLGNLIYSCRWGFRVGY